MSPAHLGDTRCHLLTPAGAGAIAVIRIAGPRALEILSESFRPAATSGGTARPAWDQLRYGEWMCNSEVLDDVIACSSNEFDGPPFVDINMHGGVRIMEALLADLASRGIPLAEPEESLRRAWPVACEVEADILAALSTCETRRGVEFLCEQGRVLPAFLRNLAEQAYAHPDETLHRLSGLRQEALYGRRIVDGVRLAVIGPPNAGKSTLANRLLGRPMSVVSNNPGTTLDWVSAATAIHGIPVTLLDLPGMHTGAELEEALALRRAMPVLATADIRLTVLDQSTPFSAAFTHLMDDEQIGAPSLLVLNKIDCPPAWRAPRSLRERFSAAVSVSATRGDNLDRLQAQIAEIVVPAGFDQSKPCLFADRQLGIVAELLAERCGKKLAGRIREELLGDLSSVPEPGGIE